MLLCYVVGVWVHPQQCVAKWLHLVLINMKYLSMQWPEQDCFSFSFCVSLCFVSFDRFINARRRILQPMLDASNPDPAPKAKKMKSQHRPTQRFWPDSIVAGVLQTHGPHSANNSDSQSFQHCTY